MSEKVQQKFFRGRLSFLNCLSSLGLQENILSSLLAAMTLWPMWFFYCERASFIDSTESTEWFDDDDWWEEAIRQGIFIENPDEFASDDDWVENEMGDDDDDDVIMEQVGGAGEESEGWWDVQHHKERHVKKFGVRQHNIMFRPSPAFVERQQGNDLAATLDDLDQSLKGLVRGAMTESGLTMSERASVF